MTNCASENTVPTNLKGIEPVLNSDSDELEALRYENAKLKKINSTLVQRIENGLGNYSGAYGSFESAVILTEKVKERTLQLQQALNELEKAKGKAEHANLTKTKFLAAVSHDLLQPMSAARLFTSALQELELSPEATKLVNSLNYSIEDVESLVGTLVDICKLDAGVVKPDIAPVNVNTLLQYLADEFRQQANLAGLRFRFVPSNAVISTDCQLLARILRNLLSNAVRYTDHGDILLGCRRQQEGLMIQVWDTGIGIPQEKLTEIFLEFKRLPNENSRGAKGLGLGLSIVDKISRILGNQIYVRSTLGKGSVFSILVPYGQLMQPQANDLAPQQPELENPVAQKRIMVIDNDTSICDGMETLLKGWGAIVHTATGIHAVDAAELQMTPPDLVLVDYHLDNDETGIDAAIQLREWLGSSLPVLMITANRTQQLKRQVRELGFHLLNKPIKPHKLKSMLRFLL